VKEGQTFRLKAFQLGFVPRIRSSQTGIAPGRRLELLTVRLKHSPRAFHLDTLWYPDKMFLTWGTT
jgi:hypothetical protein